MKRVALFTLILMLLCSFALAEQTPIPSTSLSLILPEGLEVLELDETDTEDGVIAHYCNSDGTLEMYVLLLENDGWTVEELSDAFLEEEATETGGISDINGIPAAFRVYSDDATTYIEYAIIDSNGIVGITFALKDDQAKAASRDIMNTLSAN